MILIRRALSALACVVLAACASTHQTGIMPATSAQRTTSSSQSAGGISHITVIVMENVAYESVIGNAAAPFLNSLAARSALFTNSHALGHPSEPNYLALFSGSTQGVTTDECPLTFSGDNLAAQLAAQGLTFAGYAEDAPASGNPCFAAPSSSVSSGYLYWRKHAPWTDFTNAPNAATQAYTPGVSLDNTVTFITPNICNDMHDCSVATGDAWLQQNVPGIESYDSANNGLLVITFDEGEYSNSNHIATILDGPMVTAGQYDARIDHLTLLHFIETAFGLPLLGAGSDPAPIQAAVTSGSGSGSGSGNGGAPSPSPSTPPGSAFTDTGIVGQVYGDYVHVQFGAGCGWLHVYTSAQTVYSPDSWRPSAGDTVTVHGSGSCVNHAHATEIDLQQAGP